MKKFPLGKILAIVLPLSLLIAAAGTRAYFQTAPTVTTMQAYGSSSALIQYVTVTATDGTGGNFVWQNGDKSAVCPNYGTWFTATGVAATSGCWQRQFSGPLQTAWFTSAGDFGQQYNAAYAASLAGQTIIISANKDGTKYNYTHGIVENTVGKCPNVEAESGSGTTAGGGNGGAAILNYTPTSGTAWYTDCSNGSNNLVLNRSIRNVTLLNNDCGATGGCGGSAVGFEVGTTNGGDQGVGYYNVTVQGFATGYKNLNPSFLNCCENWFNPQFIGNITALNTNAQAFSIFGGSIFGNRTAWTNTASSSGKAPEIHFHGTIFYDNINDPVFDARGHTDRAAFYLNDVKLENGSSLTCHYFEGNFALQMTLGLLENDNADDTCDWFLKPEADYTSIMLFATQVSSPTTISAIVNSGAFYVPSTLIPVISSGSTVTAMVSGTFATSSNTCSTQSSTFTQLPCNMANDQTFKGNIGAPGLPTSCGTLPTGTLWNNSNVVNVCP